MSIVATPQDGSITIAEQATLVRTLVLASKIVVRDGYGIVVILASQPIEVRLSTHAQYAVT